MSPQGPVDPFSRRHTLTAFVRLAAIDTLLKQHTVGKRHQFAIIGQQRRLDRANFLDLPFDLSNPHLLAHLKEFANVNASQNLPGKFAAAQAHRKRNGQTNYHYASKHNSERRTVVFDQNDCVAGKR